MVVVHAAGREFPAVVGTTPRSPPELSCSWTTRPTTATTRATYAHEQAAREALSFRGHLSHPVGLAVHDVGSYRSRPLVPGIVFSVDPMLWVHEERLYVRMEDTVVVTEAGVENFTDFMPSELDEIEALMREEGLVQIRPPVVAPGSAR